MGKLLRPVIITCAPTGSVHTPSMSPHLPITPVDIASSAIEAFHAGAAIIHLHARNPATGEPSPDPDIFRQFLEPIAEETDAIINITTGGSNTMTLDERLAAPKRFAPELCSLNMGTMNFDFSGAAARVPDWQFPWEEPYVRGSRDRIALNTIAQLEFIAREIGQGLGTRFEFECYDVGHLYTLRHLADQGLVQPPYFIQLIFGILGGIGADLRNLSHMRTIADDLFGSDYRFSVLAAGRHQMAFVTHAALDGGNVRVGLEDSLYIGPGELAVSNAAQVNKVKRVLAEFGLRPASTAEARDILQLKGLSATQIPEATVDKETGIC